MPHIIAFHPKKYGIALVVDADENTFTLEQIACSSYDERIVVVPDSEVLAVTEISELIVEHYRKSMSLTMKPVKGKEQEYQEFFKVVDEYEPPPVQVLHLKITETTTNEIADKLEQIAQNLRNGDPIENSENCVSFLNDHNTAQIL